MNPQSPLAMLNNSMSQGQPELNQISSTSPAGQPGLQPPAQPPMPNRFDLIHKAAARRGMNLSGHPQLQANFTQSSTPGADVSTSPASYSNDVTLPVPDDNPNQPGAQMPVSEAQLIIKALSKRMDHHSKVTEKLLDSFLPQPSNQSPE